MASRGPRTVCHVVLLLLLACGSLSHGRIVPADSDPASDDADVDGVIVWLRGDGKSCSPIAGEFAPRIGAAGSDQQAENLAGSFIQGPKWELALGKIAEWVFHACVVALAVFVLFYTISCLCACCIGLDILVEIWRLLGGWQGFSYFVRVEQAVVESEPEPLVPPLVGPAVQQP